MALTRVTPQSEAKPRTVFTLVGRVIKLTEDSMLIQRHGEKSQFWIDLNSRKILPNEGDLIECDLFISSYISKTNFFRWSLWFHDFRKLPELGENICTFWGGKGEYEIVDVVRVETKGSYIIKAKNIDTNEIFHLRSYSPEEMPTPGRHTISLDLGQLSTVINTDGLAYEDKYNAEYEKDGQKIVKEKQKWFTTLKATSFFRLESHGEGDSSKNI